MKEFENIENIYFIGIGGIGMSALARYFAKYGKQVAGYDKTNSFLVKNLSKEGISVQLEEEIEQVPAHFLEKEKTLVVFTPAVSSKNKLQQYFVAEGFTLKKRAEVLGAITKGIPTLAVAGTHGKTTTTAILAHLLKESGIKLTAFLGGVSENYNSNVILDGNEVMVVEADEFDRSFLHLSPTMAAILSMDSDHLDIYGSTEKLHQSFADFAKLVPDRENVFLKNGLPLPGKTIGINDGADFSAVNIYIDNGNYRFDFQTPNGLETGFEFGLPGEHNLQNALTALAMAATYGIPMEKLISALASFKGVQRRFSYPLKSEKMVLIDDYAHHPAEIQAVRQAIREMHPEQKVVAVFQPHLFSRTRDFANDFAKTLSQFDVVLLLDIYPAREKPIEGVDSQMLLDKIQNTYKKLIDKDSLASEIKKTGCSVVVMMGAGDIGDEVQTIKTHLQGEN